MSRKHHAVQTVFWAAASLALVGCGSQSSSPSQASVATPPPPAVAPALTAPPPPPPAPTADETLVKALDGLGAQANDRGRVVRLSSAHFKAGQTSFEPEDAARLDQVVAALKDHPQSSVLIEGYSDSRGSEKVNERLSKQRADAVREALVARGVQESRMRTRGLGEAQPVADNGTEDGRRQNRRVEMVFSNAEGRFASASDAPPSG